MKKLCVLAAALAVLTATSAHAATPAFKVYGMLAYVSPLSETEQDLTGVTEAVKASSEMGYNFGLELRMGPLLGLEFDYLYAKHELEGEVAGLLGETAFQPISATLNFHVPVGTLDLHAGPTLSYVNWSDLEVPSGGTDIELDPEVAYGITAGADLDVLPNIAATAGLRWLKVQAQAADATTDDAVDVNPLFARVGLALRF